MPPKKILWLCGWYPSELMPYNGDFIKRHAEAVSLYEDITVIYVVRDSTGLRTRSVYTETRQHKGLTESIIYYYVPPRRIKFFERFVSAKKYNSVYKATIRKYIQEKGDPDLLHVHMGMQVAKVALWLHRARGIPFVVSEHWTGFLKEAIEKFSMLPFYLKQPWKRLLQKSASISVVSKYLANEIIKVSPQKNPEVISNVVNSEIFKCVAKKETAGPVFIHVSGLDEFKNPLLILKAFKKFNYEYPGSILNIVGSTQRAIMQKAKEMGLQDSVFFYPEMPQAQLPDYMHKADALILYSKYETFGCVVIEANACGIPVIVSDIPVFHETVTEGVNGVFAGKESVDLLAAKMKWVINNKSQFDSIAISQIACSKYGYSIVGKHFSDWYERTLLNLL